MTTDASPEQMYRLRGIASGREALAPVSDGVVYRDAATGEELEPVAIVLPRSREDGSALPRSPFNLKVCRNCGQLTARDLADCEFCGLPSAE